MKRLLVVSSLVALVSVVGVFLMAAQNAFAMDLAMRIAGFTRGVSEAPSLIGNRSSKCSVAEAFGTATSSDLARAIDRLNHEVQILQTDGDMELLKTPYGNVWAFRRDHGAVIEELAEQDDDGYRVDGRVRKGDVVLDCGANVGVVTRRALQQGAGLVVAIDPGPQPLACLRRTFAKEIAEGRVIIYPKGVWDKEEELSLTSASDLASTANSVALDRGNKGPTVQLTTLDKMVEELKLTRVDFIKMDIEGAEPNALRGAAGTLAKFRPRLSISLEHRPTDPDTIPGLIHSLRPDYNLVCGPCENMGGTIQPTVVFAN